VTVTIRSSAGGVEEEKNWTNIWRFRIEHDAARKGQGSLTIVGVGPAGPAHVTLEAAERVRDGARDGSRAYGLPHAREVATLICPELIVHPLEHLYATSTQPRSAVYEAVADLMLKEAFEDGHDVLYLVPGNPLFVNDAVLLLRCSCAETERPLRIIHGLSFLDLVVDRIFWTSHHGLQLYSAWNVARDGVEPATDAPTLVFQLGEFSAAVDALDNGKSPGILEELRDRLVPRYGAGHPVVLLFSSGSPDYRSLARRLQLKDLADAAVPVYSCLWVPGLGCPQMESDLSP
jgi:hypothetical protein